QDPGQGGEEQGGPALPRGRVRDHLRRRRELGRRAGGPGQRGGRDGEERVVLLLEGRPRGAGARGRLQVAAREPRGGRGDAGGAGPETQGGERGDGGAGRHR